MRQQIFSGIQHALEGYCVYFVAALIVYLVGYSIYRYCEKKKKE